MAYRLKPTGRQTITLASTALAAFVLAVVLLAGCQSDPVPIGTNGLQGDWSGSLEGVLGVNLAPDTDVLAVAAAAENVLTRQGLSLRRRSTSPNEARVTGMGATGSSTRGCSVFVTRNPESVRLEVVHHPTGDLAASREVMEAILALLR